MNSGGPEVIRGMTLATVLRWGICAFVLAGSVGFFTIIIDSNLATKASRAEPLMVVRGSTHNISVCDARDLATVLFRGYFALPRLPIRVFRATSVSDFLIGSKPEQQLHGPSRYLSNRRSVKLLYYIFLDGTDRQRGAKFTTDVEASAGLNTEYTAVVHALLLSDAFPRGSHVIMVAHSLGGMIALQVLGDKTIKDVGLSAIDLLTFGTPGMPDVQPWNLSGVSPWNDLSRVRSIAIDNDLVPALGFNINTVATLLDLPYWINGLGGGIAAHLSYDVKTAESIDALLNSPNYPDGPYECATLQPIAGYAL